MILTTQASTLTPPIRNVLLGEKSVSKADAHVNWVTVFESLHSCLADIYCLHMQAFDRCCSGGAIVPASYGSWLIVFRERVLQAALIGVAQWVEHQVLNCRAVHVLQSRYLASCCIL